MARKRTDKPAKKEQPKSLKIAEAGIRTSRDFRNLMSAIMSDVIASRLTPNVTNAACNAGGKMLKMVDLEYKYATDPERPNRTLTIAFEQTGAEALAGDPPQAAISNRR